MNTYVDKNYLVAGDTIVLYTGSVDFVSNVVTVPGRFDQIKPRRIGTGAFSEMDGIQYIKLPYGITHIGLNAFRADHSLIEIELPGTIQEFGFNVFQGCTELKNIVIYDIKLSQPAYQHLKSSCAKSTCGTYVSPYIPAFIPKIESDAFDRPMLSGPLSGPSCAIPTDIPVLFRLEQRESSNMFKDIDNFTFVGSNPLSNENAAFVHQIKTGHLGSVSAIADLMNDLATKSEQELPKEKTYIFTFDDTKTKRDGNDVYITATLKIGYFFYPCVQKVICDKQDYFVCSRFFLSARKKIEAVKEDVAIYKGTDPVQIRKEAQRVYGKYKLLSIL